MSLSGEFNTSGNFRTKEIRTDYISDTQNSSRFSIGGKINTKSYIWHPNFLILNLEAEYNPDFIKENFIIIPDLTETRTAKRINLKTTLFNRKVISLYTTTNFSQTYSYRDYLTNIKTDTKQFGAVLIYSNKILPINLNLNQSKWNQEETETGRMADMNQLNFTARTSKSFYSLDKHSLTYSRNNYRYNNFNLYQTNVNSEIISLNDNFYFDKKRNYNFRSRLSYHNQTGTIDFKRMQAYENLFLKLPVNFKFQANYNYNDIEQEFSQTKSQNLKTTLMHKLYLSLNTSIYYEYTKIDNTFFNDENNTYGFNFNYTKKIPLKGRLNISGTYQMKDYNTIAEPNIVQIINEEHYLSDGKIELLVRPNIDIQTIIVKDQTGAIIYQENLDYILIQRNEYIEIQRFPGGQILNNSTVYVDYTATQPASYSYNSNLYLISSSIKLWDNLFELYFNTSKQDFNNITNTDFLSLNYYTQYTYGAKIDVKFAEAGVELEDYNSSTIPYKSERYYFNAHQNFNNKILFSISGNIKNFHLIQENEDQVFSDISAKTIYKFKTISSVSLDIAYRKQIGNGIDLDLFTARAEFRTILRQIDFTAGIEAYYKDFLSNKYIYEGIFFKIIRRF